MKLLSTVEDTNFIKICKINQETLERESAVLNCKRFRGIHSYDRMVKMIFDIHSDYGLSHDKIVNCGDNEVDSDEVDAVQFLVINIEEGTTLACNFKKAEEEYLQEYVEVMRPIALALDCLQSETNCFYGQLLPTLFSLKHKSVAVKNRRYCAQILQNLKATLTKRFDEFFSLSPTVNEAILASCFHPMFQLRWIPQDLNDQERKRIQNMCILAAEQERLHPVKTMNEDRMKTMNYKIFYIFSSPNTEV
ncbi:hypothetical protein PR048_013487 [Dryococelus australis]|uniref:Uncharacterized protein n=1 Tax=Dryococelus australis TaxID=614101 RepID=A0ABQ9HSR0_9NEOP|nr:hypothetical protein PR048_013487 [Dryococelus australis]